MSRLAKKIKDQLVSVVRSTPLKTLPFEHLEISKVFPDGVYDNLDKNLPETRFYGEIRHKDAILPDGTSARRKLELRPARLRSLPAQQREVLSAIASAFSSSEVEAAFRIAFRDSLNKRFGDPETVKFKPAVMLLRDLGGYKISVHTDTFRKAITTQYYLPSDDSQIHLGTSLHAGEGEKYSKFKTLDFLPNTGYAFPVSPESWHSVQKMDSSDRPRNSLMVIYYVHQGMLGEFINALKQLAQDLVALFSCPKGERKS
ncbi:MAG: DUF3876 domain-containing protein [Verrucomicrobia bacterium]|nr:DUF3876 domain-containing protein [Verrucomicrobiota bacterium]